jgi:hypothetical protein
MIDGAKVPTVGARNPTEGSGGHTWAFMPLYRSLATSSRHCPATPNFLAASNSMSDFSGFWRPVTNKVLGARAQRAKSVFLRKLRSLDMTRRCFACVLEFIDVGLQPVDFIL